MGLFKDSEEKYQLADKTKKEIDRAIHALEESLTGAELYLVRHINRIYDASLQEAFECLKQLNHHINKLEKELVFKDVS